MSRESKEIQVILDGRVLGQIELPGEPTFKAMAREAVNLPGLRDELQKNGVAGWGFDGGNFYITTNRKRPKAFAPNFQWYLAPMGGEVQKMDLGPNPFDDLL
jgi:hypothetical protein